jgi:hypothetical protein
MVLEKRMFKDGKNSVQIVLWWPPSNTMSVDPADFATFEFLVISYDSIYLIF